VKKNAFTLIELLVVIAIIAILAAILFPVFAQAKLAAKRAASLANVKQITLADLIYQNDYDDNFVLSAEDICDGGCPSTSPYSCVSNLTSPVPTAEAWTLILLPYIKSQGIYVDPGTGDPQGIWSHAGVAGTYVSGRVPALKPYNSFAYQNGSADYGYNYEFLSPLSFQTTSDIGNGTICCSTATESGNGRSSTTDVDPTQTVMFTTTGGFAAQWSIGLQNSTAATGSAFANAPGTDFSMLPSQDRVFFTGLYCFGTTVPHSVAGSVALGYCGWAGADPIGVLTADVRATSPYAGANVGFVDGHAKYVAAGKLAGGTDFTSATAASHPDPVYHYNTGAVLNGLISSGHNKYVGCTNALGLAAPTGYLWALDGTLSDIN